MWQVLKTTLRLDDSLEELTELREGVMLMAIVYYSKSILILNQQNQKVHRKDSRRNQAYASGCLLSVELDGQCLNLPARYVATWEVSLSWDFTGGQSGRHWTLVWLTLVTQPPGCAQVLQDQRPTI